MSLAAAFSPNRAIRALKNRRNAFVDRIFRNRKAADGRALAAHLAGKGVAFPCFAIAFNTPWVIDLLTAGWNRHCRGADLVILDNSSNPDARDAIRRICAERGIAYLALPRNPEWSPNRSHGIAMNWGYYNVVRHIRPQAFGFIDHDCIPVADYDFRKVLAGRSVFGRPRNAPGRWSLWAGFCFFRYDLTDGRAIDFKHRIEWGLDTGGGNWETLYRTLDLSTVGFSVTTKKPADVGESEATDQLIEGSFVHVGGASYRPEKTDAVAMRNLRNRLWRTYLPDCQPVIQDPS
ncbi:MAG: hypothetical protein CL534_27310 [Ahrensia sp.]|nr:hypothetical protein [Ahrensia sp.]